MKIYISGNINFVARFVDFFFQFSLFLVFERKIQDVVHHNPYQNYSCSFWSTRNHSKQGFILSVHLGKNENDGTNLSWKYAKTVSQTCRTGGRNKNGYDREVVCQSMILFSCTGRRKACGDGVCSFWVQKVLSRRTRWFEEKYEERFNEIWQ